MATLLDTTDAMVWAEEFCRIFNVGAHSDGGAVMPTVEQEGLMLTWFANAMGVAEREAAQKFCPHPEDERITLSDDLTTCRPCGKLNPD